MPDGIPLVAAAIRFGGMINFEQELMITYVVLSPLTYVEEECYYIVRKGYVSSTMLKSVGYWWEAMQQHVEHGYMYVHSTGQEKWCSHRFYVYMLIYDVAKRTSRH